jgi:hypothetical protein
VDTFVVSSWGPWVMGCLHGLLTTPSGQSGALLACGWALAPDRHPMTTAVWLTGAPTVQHWARFSVCLGCPRAQPRGQLWGAGIRWAAQGGPAGAVLLGSGDDTPKQKAGPPRAGRARDRHGAGSARHASRTWRGGPCGWGLMPSPLTRWPGHARSVPVGGALSRKAPPAQSRTVPSPSRRPVARALLDVGAEQGPGRAIRSVADGGSATQDTVLIRYYFDSEPARTCRSSKIPQYLPLASSGGLDKRPGRFL